MDGYGAILRACRLRAGKNQDELAFELNINQSDVSKIEQGDKEPVLSQVKKWVEITQTQEVLVAFICGVDGLQIMQQVIELANETSFIGMVFRLLGGI